jgi:hypothetical protein
LQRSLALACGENEKIPIKKIRQALLILIKHHIVITEVLPEDAHLATSLSKIEMTGLVYRIDLIAVIRRLKYGQMLQHINAHYSIVAEIMVEILIVNGSMTINQLISSIQQDPRVDADEDELKLTFNKLVQDRFVVLCPPLEVNTRSEAQSFQTISAAARTINSILSINSVRGTASSGAAPATSTTDATAKKGPVKRGRKPAAGAVNDASNLLPAELRAATASNAAKAATAAVVASVDFNAEESAPAAKKRRVARGTAVTAAKDVPSAVTTSAQAALPVEFSDSIVNPDSRWKVGIEQFLKVQKHKICIEFVQEQCGGLAEVIAKVILTQSIQQEVDCHAPRSMNFSLLELQQAMKVHQAGTSSGAAVLPTDFSTLRDVLEVMRHSSIKAVLKAGDVDDQDKSDVHSRYVINYEGIFSALRRRTIHSIAIGKFGQQSARVLELLLRNPYLEQQTITDRAILPARETRERLYALFLHGWASYQELSKRSDFSASSSAFFWYVDHNKLQHVVTDHVYKALFNLQIQRQKEIAVFQAPVLLSKEDEVLHRQHQRHIELLNFAEQQLDQTLIVLEQTV